jgi:hypothetical protein
MAGWAFLALLIQYGVVFWVELGTKSAGHEVATPTMLSSPLVDLTIMLAS